MVDLFRQLHARVADSVLRVPDIASLPTAASEGDIRYVDDQDKIYVYTGSAWIPSAGGVSGPTGGAGSSTDNAVARWDGINGDTLQNSPVIISDAGAVTGVLTLNGLTFTGDVVLAGDATNALNPVTKQQFDAAVFGLTAKAEARVASTSNVVALVGEQTIDGVLTSASRVLLLAQSAPAENGLWVTAAGAWTRPTDFDSWSEVPGALVPIGPDGTSNKNSLWVSTSATSGTINVTSISFVQVSGPGTYTTDGQGLTLVGTQFSLVLDGSTLSKSASGLKIASGGVTNTEVSGSAAIAYSKLALSNSIVNADINASAAIVYSKLSLSNSIVDADVNTAAAIAGTKISPNFGSQNVVTTGFVSGTSLAVTGTGTAGVLDLVRQTGTPATPPASHGYLYTRARTLNWLDTGGFNLALSMASLDSSDTWTFPATASATIGEFVGTQLTQTLTNKTLTAPVISSIVNTGTLTLPTATDTLIGRVSSDLLANRLQNKDLDTGTVGFVNPADTSKRFVFSQTGNTATTATISFNNGSSGTFTLPGATDTLVGRLSTDTLTNKSISGSTNTLTNISLTTSVTGVLPTANGGTGQNSTATFPTSGVVVTEAATETLTNKNLSSGTNTYRTITQSVSGVDTSSGQRLGTNTNDDAAAGFIGEELHQSRLLSAETNLTTNTTLNVTATKLTLTAGDWDIAGAVNFDNGTGTSVTVYQGAISKTSATMPATDTIGVNTAGEFRIAIYEPASISNGLYTIVLPPHRVSLSASTDFYLVAQASFTVSTLAASGSIWARRVR